MKRNVMRRAAALAAVAMVIATVGGTAAQADVNNGTFDETTDPWWSYGTSALEPVAGEMCATSSAADRWGAGVGQEGITLTAGAKQLSFKVTGTGTFKVNVETPTGPANTVLGQEFTIDGTETLTYDFTAAATTNGKVLFEVGGNAAGHTVCLDDISITDKAAEVTTVIDHDFEAGNPGYWAYTNGGATYAITDTDGVLCFTTSAANRWDAGLGFNNWPSVAGDATLSFDVRGEGIYKVNVEVPDETPAVLASAFTVTDTEAWVSQSFDFAIPAGTGKLMFEVGGEDVCFDNVKLTVTESTGGPEEPTDPPLQGGVNLLANGDFSTGVAPWSAYGHEGGVTGGQYCGTVNGALADPWSAGLGQNDVELPPGDYVFAFDASTTGTFTALLQNATTYATYASTPVTGEDTAHYEIPFTISSTVPSANLQFHLGPLAADASYEFCIDNVFLGAPSVEYVTNGTFDDGQAPWLVDGATSSSIVDGALCVEVPGGTANPWSVNVHYDGMELPAGPYSLTFKASGTGGPMRALVGLGEAPYTVYSELNATPNPSLEEYALYFTMNNPSANAQIAFQVGGSSAPWTFCIDDVSLVSGGEAPAYTPETGPSVKVNQHGYLADGPKRATLVTDATDPVAWTLTEVGDDEPTATGVSTPKGVDPSAGLNVHVIDFGGTYDDGLYELSADGATSYHFLIGNGLAEHLYDSLLTDALNYFYLARSGIEIEASIVGDAYARPAGHVSIAGGGDVNQGDYNVACQLPEESQAVYGEPWTCDYTLDVVGGWYDAGDHGKYVVNGGIATAQLLGTYERALRAGPEALAAVGDGSLNLPEHGNGIPDVLDEAKWELDFMKSMTVPEGEELAGMVHHKVHDYGWTGLPLLPHLDDKVRYLHRPSTAATLNFAATAAQGARLFEAFDEDYAAELLAASRVAWAAALEHPAIYATAADGANGGGPYNDNNVTDEFYWAAAELYLTTGDAEFLTFLQASPVADQISFSPKGFSWDQLDAIAKINLATVDSAFPDRRAIAEQVVAGAHAIEAVQNDAPFGQPLAAEDFVWGSNSQIVNNIVVLAAGYDLSGDSGLREAAYESMDYVLGRNALANSYITGYGTSFSKNQHSRWFANQLNPEMPNPPKGSLSGGPNTNVSTWDPTFAALYPAQDCAPQFCYVDHIQSWATNEITVNWNSALSAAASFLTAPNAPVTLPDHEFTAAPVPTITGGAYLGGTLKANVGTWSPTPDAFTYQWHRNGTAIAGATGSTYKLVNADSAKNITVTVTATKSGYAATSRTSQALTLAKFFTQSPAPKITGTVKVGSTVKAAVGTWAPKPSSFSYQWYRDGKAISKATKSQYKLTTADAGKKITVKVTAKRAGYASTPKTSAAKSVPLVKFTKAPAPKIVGAAKVGVTLKASLGTWSPKPKSVSYQWYRNGKAISKATKSQYKLTTADAGKKVTVKVTAKRAGYATTAKTSAAKSVPLLRFKSTPVAKVTGTLKVGSTLTAVAGNWSPKPTSFSYQWYRAGQLVRGATNSTYKLTAADKGKGISVKVTAKKSGYAAAEKFSIRTSAVK